MHEHKTITPEGVGLELIYNGRVLTDYNSNNFSS